MWKLKTVTGGLLALAMMTGCDVVQEEKRQETLRTNVEDSIGMGRTAYASRCINQQLMAAKDSDAYYLWLSMRNKLYYTRMQTDSMKVTMNRIQQYISSCNHKARKPGRGGSDFNLLQAEWLLAKGVWHTAIMGRPDSGLVYNNKAIEQLKKINARPQLMLSALTNQADYYRQLGKLDYSADAYMQALALSDTMNNPNANTAVELGIATVYTFMADYENSNKWWKRAEQHVSEMHRADQFIFYNNRGNDLYLQQRYSEALPYFKKAATLVKGDSTKAWDYYTARANMGEIYVWLGHTEQARQALDEADAFFQQAGFDIVRYYIETSRIGLDLKEGHTDRALKRMAEASTPKHMLPAAVVQRLKIEELVYRTAKMMPQAYAVHQQKDAIIDSIQTANMTMRMNANLLQYQHNRKLDEQQHIIDRQYIMGLLAWGLFLIATLIIIVLGILVYLRHRQHQLHNLEVRQQIVRLRMENIRNRISPHFIFNALNHEMLAQMNGKKVNLSSLTQLLRRGLAQTEMLETTLSEELAFIKYYVSIESQQMESDFRFKIEKEKNVNTDRVFIPAMVVQIYVENAIKHGLRPKKIVEGKYRDLLIKIHRKGTDSTEIEVLDNGMGLGPTSTEQMHTGMKVVQQTIQMLNEHNNSKIAFGIMNRRDLPAGETGCRSWITVPDSFDFLL